MDNIWSPWRMEFIQDKRFKGEEGPCIFCELGKAKPDNKSLVLRRAKENYIVMNKFPYTNGHLLIVPFQHTPDLKSLSPAAHQEMLSLMGESMDILSSCLKAEGFNCGLNVGRVAGCGILQHCHWHVVPRWHGDTNFLPVLCGTRIMPEYLSATYDRLAGSFQKKVV